MPGSFLLHSLGSDGPRGDWRCAVPYIPGASRHLLPGPIGPPTRFDVGLWCGTTPDSSSDCGATGPGDEPNAVRFACSHHGYSPPQRGGVRGGEKTPALRLRLHPTPPSTASSATLPVEGQGGPYMRLAPRTAQQRPGDGSRQSKHRTFKILRAALQNSTGQQWDEPWDDTSSWARPCIPLSRPGTGHRARLRDHGAWDIPTLE
jgi:hypothetical protein